LTWKSALQDCAEQPAGVDIPTRTTSSTSISKLDVRAGNEGITEKFQGNQDSVHIQEMDLNHKRKRRPPVRSEDSLWK
jgi:hypothetical protein